MSSAKESFTSADALPVKLLQDLDVAKNVQEKGIILPVHVQILPTNRCNLKCGFCSCAEEDRELEMDMNDIHELFRVLPKLGTKAITITGGGEPTMFPHLGSLVFEAWRRNIKVGLVTNGLLLDDIGVGVFPRLTWCRISASDERKLNANVSKMITAVSSMTGQTDWAFSYVVSPKPDLLNIKQYIKLADDLKFSHIRLVADLLDPRATPMKALEEWLADFLQGISIPVIFQARATPEHGKDCRICYLRPLIGPDMNVYACCGVQYALPEPSKKLPKELCLGRLQDFPALIATNSTQPFKGGELCTTCYYGEYNRILGAMTAKVVHSEFV
jgi:organic radical activating enzyme